MIVSSFIFSVYAEDSSDMFYDTNSSAVHTLSVTEYDFGTGTERTYNITYVDREIGEGVEINTIETPQLPSAFLEDSETLPNKIIDDAIDRVPINYTLYDDYPYTAVCKAAAPKTSSSYTVGTVFIVGKRIGLTAAHLMYSSSGIWTNNMHVTPHPTTEDTISSIYAQGTAVLKVIIPTEYKTQRIAENDWAILVFEDDIGTVNGTWDLSTTPPALNSGVNILGYPGGLSGMWYSYGTVSAQTSEILSYTCDTTGGSSGSPVYTKTTTNGVTTYKVVAIHTAASKTQPYNFGPCINRFITAEVNRLDAIYS